MISDPYNFHPRVRVGDIQNGGVVGDVPDTAAAQAINGTQLSFMRPAGWLNNETLLIEVRGQDWGDVSLLRFDITIWRIVHFLSRQFRRIWIPVATASIEKQVFVSMFF